MSGVVRDEQRKYLASALNNLGVASIVTGGIAPVTAVLAGSLEATDPLRLGALVSIWLVIGIGLVQRAQAALKDLGR